MSIGKWGNVVIAGFLVGAGFGCSEIPATPDRETEAVAPNPALVDTRLQRSDWFEALPSALDEELCSKDSTLRKCYPVSDEECHHEVRERTVSCEEQYRSQVPTRLRSNDTAHWGGRIGECAGGATFDALDSRFQNVEKTAECQQLIQEM